MDCINHANAKRHSRFQSFLNHIIIFPIYRDRPASLRLKKTLYRLGLSPDIIRRAAISTYEAEINIVAYTDGGEITAYIDPHQIKIIITDKGPGIPDVEKALQPGFSTAPGWVRELGFGAGMGLPNIKKFTDKMTLRSTVEKGTHLEIIIKLSDYRIED